MGWEDGLEVLDRSRKTSWTGWQQNQASRAMRGWAGTQEFNPYRASSAAMGYTVPRSAAGSLNPKYPPAGFPQKIEFTVPTSAASAKPAPPTQNTQGDFLASLGASWENAVGTGGYLNLGNAIPWGMERMGVLAETAAADLAGDDENAVGGALDFIGQGIKAISEHLAPVIEWMPNAVRDRRLDVSAEMYRKVVTGEELGKPGLYKAGSPMEQLLQALGVVSKDDDANRAAIAAAIDIPDSVKASIRANPAGDIRKYFDESPEGRQYTYMGGPGGFVVNMGSAFFLYGVELLATFGWAGAIGAAGAASSVPAVVTGTRVLATGARIAGRVQQAFLASGLGWFGLSTMTDAIARTMGDEKAVEWFDKVNRSTIISDDPAVQLVTGFTVDPFRSANLARRGTVALAKGLGNVTVGRVVGQRLTKLYTKEELIRDTIAKMYGTTREGAGRYVGPDGAYESWQEAMDRVVELAWDHVATTLPEAERIAIGAIVDGAERTKAVLAQYGNRIADTIEKHPEAIAARLRRDWEYRDAAGPWDPDVQAIIERDYLAAKKMTVEARQRTGAVLGYVEYLNPEGQSLLAREIDDLFADGATATLRDLNRLNAKYPAIRSLYRDLVAGKSATEEVSREVFDTVLQRATDAHASAMNANPVRVASGVDPILRPGSVRRVDEYAEALGTAPETIKAIETNPSSWTAEQTDLVTAFAKEKGVLGDAELAGVSAEELWTKVTDWVDNRTAPWLKRGEQVEALERDFAQVSDRIKEIDEAIGAARRDGQQDLVGGLRADLNAAHAERGRLYNLLSDVREPEVPFSQSVKFARREALDISMVERAKAKVAAMEAIETITHIDDEVGSWNTISPRSPLSMIRRARNGNWSWSGNAPAMSDSLYRKLAEFLSDYGGPEGQRIAAAMSEMGDEQLWALVAKHRDAAQFRRSLTGSQRRVVDRASSSVKSTVDEYQGAWARGRERAGEAVGEDEFLDYLGRMRDARDNALNGRAESVVRRSAGASLPEWAVEQARMGERADLWYDPEAVVAAGSARASLGRALDGGAEAFPAVREIIDGDPLLRAQAEKLAADRGMDYDALVGSDLNADALRSLVDDVVEGAEPHIPGVPRALTDLDHAILSGDPEALSLMREGMDALRGRVAPPLRNVPADAAAALARRTRPSVELAGGMRDAGVGWHDPIPLEMWAGHDLGAKVASMILHGDTAHPPRTPQALLRVLKEIENGNAENIGVGVELAAEAQRAAKSILGKLTADARAAQFDAGVLGMGRGLNPHTWAEDTFEVIRDLFGKHGEKAGIVIRDDALGLQYGLKQRPKSAVVLEMSAVPGLAEELLTGHFRPFNERIFGAQVRQQFNHIFLGHHNQEIAFAARGRFIDALAPKGVPADLASRIWRAWKERAVESRGVSQEKIAGEFRFRPADNAMYASERNIPNAELNAIAHREAEAYFRGIATPEGLRAMDFADTFRVSTSFTRRQLEKLPMGEALEKMYGAVAHNKGVTTLYYIFRFGLDLRFHALNMLEGPALYAGRALFRRDAGKLIEGDEGLFGMTRQAIESFAKDGLHDTGYPFSHSRAAWAYKTFLKEQPDALRGLLAEDPKLMQDAIEALAKYDPELSATIKAMGDTPEAYLKALDKHYRKIMDSADPEAVVSKEIMKEAVGDPALAELYGRLADVNQELWGSVRATFFGNPARSQVERALNHYLLYWPISYQIKATKWLGRIMFDRAAGLKTNAGGAVAFDRMMQYHQELIETDPEYREFLDEHPTLLFAAQMLFPMTPGSIGVGLSPLTRDLLFGASKQIAAVGPVYTVTKLLPDLAGDLYQDFGGVPGIDPLYRMIAGREPPKD